MKFYDLNKTFLELVADYKGDMDEAYNLFSDAYDAATDTRIETRVFSQALGIPNLEDYAKFELDEIDVSYLLKKYGKAAASIK